MKHGTLNGYNKYGCRCDACTQANADNQAAKRLRLVEQEPPEHGTVSAYRNYSCRCEPCRKAGSDDNRRQRDDRRRRMAEGEPPPLRVHGTVNGYNNWFCRCDACTTASRERYSLSSATER